MVLKMIFPLRVQKDTLSGCQNWPCYAAGCFIARLKRTKLPILIIFLVKLRNSGENGCLPTTSLYFAVDWAKQLHITRKN